MNQPDLKGPSETDSQLVRILDDYLAKLQSGIPPARKEVLADHPELADELEDCLAGLEYISQAASASQLKHGEGKPPGVPLGDFRILQEIGRGGMGVVYEAEQLSLGRRVALKVLPFAAVLDERRLQRFQNEARAAASLKHANIVGVHSVGCERGVHYYAMEYVEGQTLAEVIAGLREGAGTGRTGDGRNRKGEEGRESERPITGPPLSGETFPLAALSTEGSTRDPEFFRTVARLGIQAAEALEHAHGMGVVHRDIKPSNLMVDDRGHLWITDFGLAMTHTDANLTMTGDVLGTLRYMSPEQVEAKHGVLDHRTDVYSLGLTLYELLTLQPAFGGDDRQKLLRQVAEDDPAPPRQLNKSTPKDLETIVLKATAKEPERRYASAGELADDLRRFTNDQPIYARRPTMRDRMRKWLRRHRRAVSVAAIVTAIMLAIGAVLVWHGAQREARERRRTEETLQLALSALDQMYLDLVDQKTLEFAGEGMIRAQEFQVTPEAEKFLKRAISFYEQFRTISDGEAVVKRETADAYARAGDIRSRLGNHAQGEADCRRAIELAQELVAQSPSETDHSQCLARAYEYRGRVYSRKGDFKQVIADCSESIRLSPDYPFAYRLRAYAFYRRGASQKALADIDSALRSAPYDAVIRMNRGNILAVVGRLDEAIVEYDIALKVDPSNAIVLYNQGNALRRKGQIDQASAKFSEALTINPRLPRALHNRGSIHAGNGEFAEAIEDYSTALHLAPGDFQAHHARGLVYLIQGDFSHAIGDVRKAYELRPAGAGAKDRLISAQIQNDLAWLLSSCPDPQLRDPKLAVELAAEAVKVAGFADFLETLGLARYRAGDFAGATKALERLSEGTQKPKPSRAFFLAMAYWRMGSEDKARQFYDRATVLLESGKFDRRVYLRFRDEAADLLGIAVNKETQKQPPGEDTEEFPDAMIYPWSAWQDCLW